MNLKEFKRNIKGYFFGGYNLESWKAEHTFREFLDDYNSKRCLEEYDYAIRRETILKSLMNIADLAILTLSVGTRNYSMMQTIPILEGVRLLSHLSFKNEIESRAKGIEESARFGRIEEMINRADTDKDLFSEEDDSFLEDDDFF